MKTYLLVLILLLSLWIGGCNNMTTQPSSLPVPSATVKVTTPPLPMLASNTPQKPTAIIKPSVTREIPTPTSSIVMTLVAVNQPRTLSSLLSPDGQWKAEVVIFDCTPINELEEYAYEQLNLTHLSSDSITIIDSQLLSCGGIGAFGLDPLFWSSNSNYIYYTNAREGQPGGCGHWVRPIIRFDVNNRLFEHIGGGTISPDGTMLATWKGQELVIWDINTAIDSHTTAYSPESLVGPITWSPDNNFLIYVQFSADCPLSGKSYVVRVSLPDLKQSLLLESEKPTFGYVVWETPDEIRLFDENGYEWLYSITSQQLELVP